MELVRTKYTTAVDISPEVDRFAAFFIIVSGVNIYEIIAGITCHYWLYHRIVQSCVEFIIPYLCSMSAQVGENISGFKIV
jgi:hypothetical protein